MELQAEYVANVFKSMRQEMRKAVVGNDEVIELLLIAFYAGGHVLLEGVPGLGKTTLLRTLGEAMHLKYSR
ncbi:MAG: AAA family ATPase, partial [Myxococcales bacterium]|nr:AAA family ATPase [Myxococcales bacterium]